MFARLFLLFTATSLLEIFILVKVGGFLGAWPTVGLVVVTAFVGSALVRSQGIQTMFKVQARVNQGEMPGQQLIEGMMLVIAGVLLVTPGFVTDFCGLMLLQPGIRAKLAKAAMNKFQLQMVAGSHGGFHGGFTGGQPFTPPPQGPNQQGSADNKVNDGNTIEGEYERKE
ncbi:MULTISPECIES: FxsA family protein [unclassified Motilimonas]|uniref:FxsA family protein n=1 Tax=Motilimonas TaxID=1914248 RepID=UPI001E3805CB|nr:MULTISPECIES: FxsA family protein [unclassified Motilimonas]MCE0555619.1 FxsA family protein [Motilimonas sp. E26]MDO6526653.1 FxsA family protein [Motilimonas sp. 1_MG-2023]